ncbi:MAG: bifunctional phosphoribosylaminoimidazolecarboxamide formyltransferase/IMP cyclohydrolase [Brevinematia bacterium]
MINDKFAIVSVYDKQGIVDFCRGLNRLGYRIVSTSGTYKILKDSGVDVVEVSSITNFPEILDGRVKTLHPKIHGGILFKPTNGHKGQVDEYNIPNIEIVVVSFYPFEQTIGKTNDLNEIIENIDIGGPTLLRAGAKNFERVLVVIDKRDYSEVLRRLENNENTLEFRMELAAKAFSYVSRYDALISDFFNNYISKVFPEEGALPLKKIFDLRYGENPHQKASAYITTSFKGSSILNSQVLGGKELSYNNILDADVALSMMMEFANENFCCIIKHNTPCGASVSDNLLSAYRNAFRADPASAFGGIVGFSKKVDKELAEELVKTFFEVIVAPDYDENALDVLKSKKNLRIIKVGSFTSCAQDLEVRSVRGGVLVQEKDISSEDVFRSEVVTKRKPTELELKDMDFAWRVVKFVKSNAIVIAKDGMTLGICGGQTSRVDSVKISISRAKEFGFDLKGAVCASDAFFPFKDSVEILAKEGVSAIVQPGGSIRDNESIEEADKNNIAMVFTRVRHFRH